MIYITGDTHIPIDIAKLNNTNFPQQSSLTKDDYVIICGDFGGVWNYRGEDKEEKYWLDWLNDKPFTTLFVDGNHECFPRLNALPQKLWHGGKVHVVRDSIYHLMRGQIFEIDNKTFLTLGGASSYDRGPIVGDYASVDKYWWKEELPSEDEYNETFDNIEKVNLKVDYIITHCLPTSLQKKISPYFKEDPLNYFLEVLYERMTFKHWYCGHYHTNKKLNDKVTILYEDIIQLED